MPTVTLKITDCGDRPGTTGFLAKHAATVDIWLQNLDSNHRIAVLRAKTGTIIEVLAEEYDTGNGVRVRRLMRDGSDGISPSIDWTPSAWMALDLIVERAVAEIEYISFFHLRFAVTITTHK